MCGGRGRTPRSSASTASESAVMGQGRTLEDPEGLLFPLQHECGWLRLVLGRSGNLESGPFRTHPSGTGYGPLPCAVLQKLERLEREMEDFVVSLSWVD